MTKQEDPDTDQDPDQDMDSGYSRSESSESGGAESADMYATTVTDEDDETWFCIKDRDGGAWIRSTFSKNLRKFR